MKNRSFMTLHNNIGFFRIRIIYISLFLFVTCLSMGMESLNPFLINNDADINGDGGINILVLGTNSSLNGGEAFSPQQN